VPLGNFTAPGFPEILRGKGTTNSYFISVATGYSVVTDTTCVSECRWSIAGQVSIGVKNISNRRYKEK
jgi:hypothetical protein